MAGLLTPPAQATLLLSLPTIVNVTVPVGFVPGMAVVGVTMAVKFTAWPVVRLVGALTDVVVGAPSALALNEFRARVPTVATAPAPAMLAIFLSRLLIMLPPRADPVIASALCRSRARQTPPLS
jgi:hypothetical protein